MAVDITSPDIQKVIQALLTQPGVNSATAEEPTALYLREIHSKYTLLPNICMFVINFTSDGIEGIIQFISPEEHYKTVDSEYLERVGFINDAARLVKGRSNVSDKTITLYFQPGASQSDMLRGYSLVPIADPSANLQSLIDRANAVNGIQETNAYEAYDTAEETVSLNCILVNLPIHTPTDVAYEPVDHTSGMISYLLLMSVIEDTAQHDSIIDKLASDVAKLQ